MLDPRTKTKDNGKVGGSHQKQETRKVETTNKSLYYIIKEEDRKTKDSENRGR